LGDDVVIASGRVAKEYQAIMKEIGVEIGLHKSLISTSGRALEFAKRTFLDGEDVSPISFKEFVVARKSIADLLELSRKYSLSLGGILSLLGYGYRAKASLSKRLPLLSRRLRNLVVACYGPTGPFFHDLKTWLGMKSLTSVYRDLEGKVQSLIPILIEQESKRLLELLDQIQPLVGLAKRLGTVYRDREHYGAVSRSADRDTQPHPGTERSVPPCITDSLNETVYREAFLDTVIAVRDLRTQLEELSPSSLETGTLEGL